MLKIIRKYRYPYLFIAPYFLLFLLFQLIPMLRTVKLSFYDWNGLSAMRHVGLNNYALMFRDYMFLDAVRNTFVYWAASAAGVMTLSVLIAVCLVSRRLKCPAFFKTTAFLPYVCASVAMGLIFGMLFEENAGLINQIIVSLGGERVPWLTSGKTARIPVVVLHVWRLTPWYTMIVLSGLLSIPEEYYEAACIDGAGKAQQFMRITLPLLGNILFFCLITVTVDSWKLFNESYVLPGPGSSNMSLFQLMYQSGFSTFKMGYASAVGCVLMGILLVLSMAQFAVRRRTGEV